MMRKLKRNYIVYPNKNYTQSFTLYEGEIMCIMGKTDCVKERCYDKNCTAILYSLKHKQIVYTNASVIRGI